VAMTPRSVLHIDPERGFSGGEAQVLALMSHLRDAGHEGLLACHPGGPLAERAIEAGLATVDLACSWSHQPSAGRKLRRIARERRPHIVHFHTSRALSLAPYVPGPAVKILTRRMDYPPRGADWYVRALYGCLDGTIAISAAVREALASRGLDRAAIDVVPSGVEVARFRAPDGGAAARRAFGIAPDRKVIAVVASLHARKGHSVLLRALARLAVARVRPLCLAAGTGPEGQALLELARDLGLGERVRWLGQLADVRRVLWAADLVVVPSLAEGLGVAAIEAMAAARPVVASEVGGLPELVRHGTEGFLVPAGDDIALAEALTRCLADADLRTRMAAAGARRAAEFSTAAMASGTEAVYERLLGGDAGAGNRSAPSVSSKDRS
jgi:glycosyltransferase involved in cell wall biosynthesis